MARTKGTRRKSSLAGAKPKAFKAVRLGPITGPEPDWIHDLPVDNLVNAITALAGEVYILRERQRVMERELARRRVVPAGAVEDQVATPEERESDAADLKAFVARLWSEIARTREPWARVDPKVVKFFKQPK
jgi:hypothetical protein